MTERVLVTGAAGFIGSHLCRRLDADGVEVVGFDDLSEGSPDRLHDVPSVRLAEGDLRDEAAVRSAARGCTAIFHLGAKRSVERSFRHPDETVAVNVGGTRHVLEAARVEGARVVAASSSSVYGNQDVPLRESAPPAPRSPYASSKLEMERSCAAWARSSGVATVSLRYFNVYGPGQDPASEYAAVVPIFITRCLTGRPVEIHGDGTQARDFTYVDDVVDATILASRAPEASGQVINVGGGATPTSVHELLSRIASLVGSEPEIVRRPARRGDVTITQADLGRARRLLGYRPRVPIDEGLRRTVAWLRTPVEGRPSSVAASPVTP